MSNKKRTLFEIILIIFIFAVAIGIGIFFAFHQKKGTVITEGTYEESTENNLDSIYNINFKGQKFELNQNIETLLFLGIDTREKSTIDSQPGYNGQADCILLLLMNKETDETTVLEISRETMVGVDVYDSSGSFLQSTNAQLCLQYAYGDGDTKSSWLMKNQVSKLLHNIPINYTLALNLDGFGKITDALGGVEITVPEDYSYIEPEFVKGKTITLDGRLAERYVRYRDITVSGSNAGRMERQTQFIPLLVSKAKNVISDNSDEFYTLYNTMKPYMSTDLSMDSFKSLINYSLAKNIEVVPGEVRAGLQHDEFYVDDEKLMELLIKLFYK